MKIIRQAEREIVRATIEAAIRHGFTLHSAADCDINVPLWNHGTVDEAVEFVFERDEALIFFTPPGGDPESNRGLAWIFVVLGNEGWTVISDYTVNLQAAVDDTDALVDKWEELLS